MEDGDIDTHDEMDYSRGKHIRWIENLVCAYCKAVGEANKHIQKRVRRCR
jgi:hypothetical protein